MYQEDRGNRSELKQATKEKRRPVSHCGQLKQYLRYCAQWLCLPGLNLDLKTSPNKNKQNYFVMLTTFVQKVFFEGENLQEKFQKGDTTGLSLYNTFVEKKCYCYLTILQ